MNSVLTTSATRRVAILQSNYIPWKGYFDIIRSVDDFVVYDDVQYTKNDWRNRNRIKTRQGLQWLTIPVRQDRLSQTIRETKTADTLWRKKHWMTLRQSYGKARFFRDYEELFANAYLGGRTEWLSEINLSFIEIINHLLGITTRIHSGKDYSCLGNPTERLIEICHRLRATEYVSGPAAKSYLDEQLFCQAGIDVSWIDYSGYPEYRQIDPPFEHSVSVLDLIFCEGPHANRYTKQF